MSSDKTEHVVVGYIVCIRDEDEHLDEVSCLVWFNGEDDDVTTVKITTPAGMFQLRDKIVFVVSKSERKYSKLVGDQKDLHRVLYKPREGLEDST